MKLFAAIVSLYVFTASVSPCSDTGGVIFSLHGNHATEQTDASNSDDCSTFCICNCCGIVFDVPTAAIVPNSPFVYSHRAIQTTLYPLTGDLSSIWQPPKA